MSEKNRNKYRIKPARLPNWDYRWAGAYFITICTQNRMHYFGKVVDGNMVLSNIGMIANKMWYEIKHHTGNVELGAFIVMPNHVHGILILNNKEEIFQKFSSKIMDKNKFMSKISPKSNSLSTIIRSYKSAVSKHVHRLGYQFAWQPRFYDHLIRDPDAYDRITQYIINNPAKWGKDKFFT